MSIDFPCSNCQRTIRVPDGSEGKKTKCPKCDEVQRIPGTPAEASSATPGSGSSGGADLGPDAPPETPSASRPIGNTTVPETGAGQALNPFGETASDNPFASPAAAAANVARASQVSRDAAKATLMGPAVGMIIITILAVVGQDLLFVVQAIAMQDMMQEMNVQNEAERIGFLVGFYGVPVVLTIFGTITLVAMTRALAVRNYGFVMAGFILGMIPCTTGYCCVLSLPFCIWGIVVLCDDSVKAAFRLP